LPVSHSFKCAIIDQRKRLLYSPTLHVSQCGMILQQETMSKSDESVLSATA